MTGTDSDRSFASNFGPLLGLGAVAIAFCGGCLYLGVFITQIEFAGRAKDEEQFVAAGTAAVMEHFGGEVTIVKASLERPTENGYFVAGQYQRPGDRQRDFLATVDRAGDGCRVSQLIVDGDVVVPKPSSR